MKKLYALIFSLLIISSFLVYGRKTFAATRQFSLPTSTPAIVRINTENFEIVNPTLTPAPLLNPTLVPTIFLPVRKIIITPSPTPQAIREIIPVGGINLNIEKDKFGQEKWLNPQPEPPIFISSEVRKNSNNAELTWPAFTAEAIKSKVEFTPNEAILDIPNAIKESTAQVKLLIKSNFKIEGNKFLLTDGNMELRLNTFPIVLYQKLNSVSLQNKFKLMEDFSLGLEQGKAIYSITIEEPVKLFGLIPLKIKEKLTINDQDGKAKITGKPWYSFIVKETADIIGNMELLPNLVLKNVSFTPDKFSQGDLIKIKVTIANEGLVEAVAFPHFGLPGEVGGAFASLYISENGKYKDLANSWSPVLIYLEPEQEWVFDYFNEVNARCGEDYKISVATEEFNPQETSKEDNTITGKINCQ